MKQTLLAKWRELSWIDTKVTKALPLGEGVLDTNGFNALEVDKLFDAINCASTLIGQAVLYRSLAQPMDKIHEVEAKQAAVEELQNNPELKSAVETLIAIANQHETNLYRLLFGEFLSSFGTARNEHEIEGYGYLQYKRAIRFITELVEQVQHAPQAQSAYLQSLFEHIKAFAGSRTYCLMTEAVYLTETQMQSKQERKTSFMPAVVFYPRIIKPMLLVLAAIVYGALDYFVPFIMEAIPQEALFLSPFLLLYFPLVGSFDRDHFIIPLRNEFKNCDELAQVLDAVGQMDELLSFLKLNETFGHAMVLPTLIESEQHRITLHEAMNPILAKQNPDYVGNNLSMDHEKLLLITGPNSGGKTAFCKTVTQIQLMAQIGGFVPAQAATLSIADRIFYQVPEISQLNDGEGRFGTELKRTKDIFLASSARSFVVLDELSEGTTFEEKMESSATVLDGFYRKGNSTILITHNHQLVDKLLKQRMGVARQVEFIDDAPTHRLIAGISRVSHADRVAKKIGFSRDDINRYLLGK
ncbi:MAG: DNA mismatch repair protein MutS [Methylococcaceae bacterium]